MITPNKTIPHKTAFGWDSRFAKRTAFENTRNPRQITKRHARSKLLAPDRSHKHTHVKHNKTRGFKRRRQTQSTRVETPKQTHGTDQKGQCFGGCQAVRVAESDTGRGSVNEGSEEESGGEGEGEEFLARVMFQTATNSRGKGTEQEQKAGRVVSGGNRIWNWHSGLRDSRFRELREEKESLIPISTERRRRRQNKRRKGIKKKVTLCARAWRRDAGARMQARNTQGATHRTLDQKCHPSLSLSADLNARVREGRTRIREDKVTRRYISPSYFNASIHGDEFLVGITEHNIKYPGLARNSFQYNRNPHWFTIFFFFSRIRQFQGSQFRCFLSRAN